LSSSPASPRLSASFSSSPEATANVLRGRSCTGYPAVCPDLEQVGTTWREANETASNAVVDGNLVTAPAWPAHPEWMRRFLEVLGTKIEP